jgi:predicted MFS family arabinose efflux permease
MLTLSDSHRDQPFQTAPAIADEKTWNLYTSRNRSVFLWVLFFVGASNYVDRNIIGVLLESIKKEFLVSDAMLGLLSGISFALFYATLGIPLARWADRGNRKLIMTVSLTIWSLMTTMCGFAHTFWQLAAARVGVGAGEAGAIPSAQSLLADYYPPAQRAQAIGIFMMSSTVGYAIAVVLGGWIAQNYGWRAAFSVVGLLGLALAPLTHRSLKEPRLISRFRVIPQNHETIPTAIRLLFGKPAYRNILWAIILYFLMSYGALVFIVSFMIRVHGLSVARAGAIYGVVSAIGAVIGNVGGGALSDRLGLRDVAWLGRLAGWGMIAAMPLYELALSVSSIGALTTLLLFATVLLMGVTPPTYTALHMVCGSKRRAIAVAFAFFLANLLGLGLGPVLAGFLSDKLALTYGIAQGLRYALMIVMLVFVPGGWFMLRASRYLEADAED